MLYGPAVADDLASNVAYRNRTSDDLHLIDNRINKRDFALAMQRKSDALIDYSRASLITVYLKQLLKGLEDVVAAGNPLLPEVNIVVNFYPFNFTDEELSWLAAGIKVSLGLANPVSMVKLAPESITLDYLAAHKFFTYIMYDFNVWSTAALPDEDVSDLSMLGLSRQEGLMIVACRNAIDLNKSKEVNAETRRLGLPPKLTDLTTLPWTFLFDFEMIEHVFYTEYNQHIAEKIMANTNDVSSPIDIEVDVVGDYYEVIGPSFRLHNRFKFLLQRNGLIQDELLKLQQELKQGMSEDRSIEIRQLLAEHRFISDSLSNLLPSKPAEDFERFVDSKMSYFDISQENADITELQWNRKGVRCRRVERDVPNKRMSVFITFVLESCVDSDGKEWEKGDLLPSANYYDPIIEPTMPALIDRINKEFSEHG